jgi:hypothetical protein
VITFVEIIYRELDGITYGRVLWSIRRPETSNYISSIIQPECLKWAFALNSLLPTCATHHSRNATNRCFGSSTYSLQLRLMKAFSPAKNSSIRLRSGEYSGRYMSFTFTPASLNICWIRSVWWEDALSVASTELGASYLPKCWSSWSMKSSNTAPSAVPRNTCARRILSCMYAGRAWYRSSCWYLATCTGVVRRGDHPVRLNPTRLSHQDSSIYIRW